MSKFTFHGQPTRLDMIHNTLAPLKPNLVAKDLYKILEKNIKDNLFELGYAYYTVYYHRQPIKFTRPKSSSVLDVYLFTEPTEPIPTFVQMTDHSTPAHEACKYDDNFDMNPEQFITALRNIHPFEIMGNYYHNPNICDVDFSSFLTNLSNALGSYFNDTNVSILRNFLSGIKKCICLRVLSINAYYYGHHAIAQLSHDPAMEQLLRFYVISNLIHEWSIEKYESHLFMIRKYNELNLFIESVLSVAPTILSDNDFRFDSIQLIIGKMRFRVIDTLYNESRTFALSDFPEFTNDPRRQAYKERLKSIHKSSIKLRVKRMNQVNELLHDLQSHYQDTEEDIVKRGIHHLKLILKNLNENLLKKYLQV